ncbi:hypothetical protein PGT21_028227 [Puccinia graminis f. sp. tritici]|uniref:Uncharacterized protein n=1 Tax=Puccinia graminis f. sp. tritici TaxID=56615 RepID=A0A5B0M0K2_PUCGR|nr:hypothetical protein PGT21_028227 [Puccinia graminis f. sp. tritici]
MKTQIAREKKKQNRFPPQTSTDHSPPYGSQSSSSVLTSTPGQKLRSILPVNRRRERTSSVKPHYELGNNEAVYTFSPTEP